MSERARTRWLVAVGISLSVGATLTALACGSGQSHDFGSGGKDASLADVLGDGFSPPFNDGNPCTNGKSTRVRGIVHDPAGDLPLYNVIVYVPNGPLDPLKDGVSCDRCGTVVHSPLASALTQTDGTFVLDNVPPGDAVPLVVQVGKWRRQTTVKVVACQDNDVPDPDQTRLPRSSDEGDMPRIAIATGQCDAPECFLRALGVAEKEFTGPKGGGHVHLYTGANTADAGVPGSVPAAPALWDDVATLSNYDIAMLGCECAEHSENKSAAALQAMHDYANAGGRIFASHFQFHWLSSGPSEFQALATFDSSRLSQGQQMDVDKTFPKGVALADWLSKVDGGTAAGVIPEYTVVADVVSASGAVRPWIYGEQPKADVYFTFNTPLSQPVASQCGRFVFTDLHVASLDSISPDWHFPARCQAKGLDPVEEALAFLFFDLGSCIQDDKQPPTPPK